MSSIINKGSQVITWDFKNPAKSSFFDRVNRDIIKPGIYKGLQLNFAGNTVSVLPGKAAINCIFNNDDNLQIKVDFETLYTFSEQIYPSMSGANELFYLEYEHAEISENFVDIKHMPSDEFFLNPVTNSIIIGELQFTGNNITGISYANRTRGLLNADENYSIPDNQLFYSITTQSKKWRFTGDRFASSQTKELQFQSFSEQTGRIITTSPTNTSEIENKLSILSEEDSVNTNTGALVLQGGMAVKKNIIIGKDLEVSGNTTLRSTAIQTNLAVSGQTNLQSTSLRSATIQTQLAVSGNTVLRSTTIETDLAVSGNVTIGDRLTVNRLYGRVPLGAVIPVIGVFSATNNGGTFTSAPLPSSGSITDDGFQICNGTLINNPNSIFNGRFTPNITDDRFIQGSAVGNIGLRGGNTNNTITIASSNLPTHTHTISHGHSDYGHSHSLPRAPFGANGLFAYMYSSANGGSGEAVDGGYANISGSNTSSSGDGQFANSAIDIRPKYINAVYLMRVL